MFAESLLGDSRITNICSNHLITDKEINLFVDLSTFDLTAGLVNLVTGHAYSVNQ